MVKIIDNPEEAEKLKQKLELEIKNAGETLPEVDPQDFRNSLRDFYSYMEYIIDYYMDIPKETRNLVILWTLGTYFYKNFSAYPYLFVNAMRGSGKTRLLKIIEAFSDKGQLTMSLTEAVLFRTVGTLLLDEFEGINRKGVENLRELLNSAYKKGTKVFRMKKQKTLDGEGQVVEEFQPYRPVVMANIWGMEEVLGDRCINIHLEKSSDESKTRLVEDFQNLETTRQIKEKLQFYTKNKDCANLSVVSCSVVTSGNIHSKWNAYVKSKVTTPYTHSTLTTYNYTKLHENEENIRKVEQMLKGEDVFIKDYIPLFDKIDNTKIDGRYLELFFPLFIIASEVDDKVLEFTLETAKNMVDDKKVDEVSESKDVLVYSVVAKQDAEKWVEVSSLATIIRMMMGEGENDWLNSKWVGRSLKRLGLITKKMRTNRGIQVRLDVEKAKKKEEMFKPKEVKNETQSISS